LADVAQGRIDVIVVYKVDRLTRSLADFAKLVELFDKHGVSFVSVTQQFNGVVTATLIGRKISAGRRSRGCGRSLPCVSSFGPEQAKSWA
jgi:DNA invertase Pin-like site-specific DNA recombinase